MGTYWMAVNRTKKQYVYPHRYSGNRGNGAKIQHQLSKDGGLGAVLLVLLSRYREGVWCGDSVELLPDTYEDEFIDIEDEHEDFSDKALELLDESAYF